MISCLVHAPKSARIALVLLLALLLSGWTCSVFGSFNSCSDAKPEIATLFPNAISADSPSVPLTVSGRGFVSRSEILWNGHPVQTAFIDSRHLQTTVTREIFDSFGGSAGSNVLISVMSPASSSFVECPAGVSGVLILEID